MEEYEESFNNPFLSKLTVFFIVTCKGRILLSERAYDSEHAACLGRG
jgi:hypothetical protein